MHYGRGCRVVVVNNGGPNNTVGAVTIVIWYCVPSIRNNAVWGIFFSAKIQRVILQVQPAESQ